MSQKIQPCLWFDTQAEEAANLYVSLFKNSKIGKVAHYDDNASKAAGMPAGAVMMVEFELDGEKFLGLNGGPAFKFSEAISLMIMCEDQAEVDHFWDGLTADGGEESQCGWLKDKFGLSWQVVPKRLLELQNDPDPKRAQGAMKAMLTMKKIDIAGIEKGAEQG